MTTNIVMDEDRFTFEHEHNDHKCIKIKYDNKPIYIDVPYSKITKIFLKDNIPIYTLHRNDKLNDVFNIFDNIDNIICKNDDKLKATIFKNKNLKYAKIIKKDTINLKFSPIPKVHDYKISVTYNDDKKSEKIYNMTQYDLNKIFLEEHNVKFKLYINKIWMSETYYGVDVKIIKTDIDNININYEKAIKNNSTNLFDYKNLTKQTDEKTNVIKKVLSVDI